MQHKTNPIVVAAMLAMGISSLARAGDSDPSAPKGLVPAPDFSGDLLQRSYLTGDWGGARTSLADRGIQADVDWTQYVQSIVSGGLDTTTQYGAHLDYLVHFDLMRMNVLPGALITLRAESRYLNSVNGQSGSVLPVNTAAFFPLTDELDKGVAVAITDLNYTQFLSPQFAVSVGKLDTLDGDPNEFASGRGKSQFMNGNFLFNSTLSLRLPYSTLGAAALWMPTENVSVKASIINTADSSQTTGLTDFGNGYTATIEGDFQYRAGDLPGGFNVGALWSFDQDFNKVGGQLIFQPGQGLTAESETQTWAVYVSGWQYLYIADPNDHPINAGDGGPDHRGLGLFARAGYADNQTNPIQWSGSVGVGGRGMIPSRDEDTFGVGYFYTDIQETRIGGLLGIDDKSQGFEAYYNIALTPAVHLTLDAQLLDAALPDVDTAVILGARLNIAF